jgi:SAM-dependent methyltransferase
MKAIEGITLKNVQEVYSGPEGKLWELIMGEQIHIGGLTSSLDLADKAGIKEGTRGIDLCCCTGAGMRFLVRFKQVASMTGVDATPAVIATGRQRCEAENLTDKISFSLSEVIDTGLESGAADFVWGEDAWCYVENKPAMIKEAARLVKPGGVIAFTDWVEGPENLTGTEGNRLLSFMKFPNIQDIQGYQDLLSAHGCEILLAQNTGRFAPHIDLYLQMLQMQLAYDALKIIGFDMEIMEAMAGEMTFMQEMAHAGKISQGLFVARKWQ